MLTGLFCFVILIANGFGAPSDDPKDEIMLPVCSRNNPELTECLINATEILRDKIAKGIPELKLQSLDPLKIPTIKLDQTHRDLEFKGVLMDVCINGLSEYRFLDIETDLENMTFTALIALDNINLGADYMIMGKFQMLPIDGSGRIYMNFTDTVMEIKVKGALTKRNGETYFTNRDTTVTMDVGGYTTKFEDLYSASAEMTQIAQHMVAMHEREILDRIKPGIETIITMVIDDIGSKFYQNIPFNKLFPVDES